MDHDEGWHNDKLDKLLHSAERCVYLEEMLRHALDTLDDPTLTQSDRNQLAARILRRALESGPLPGHVQ